MSPRHDARREALSVEGRDCREAGVLVLLLPKNNDSPTIILTVRHEELPDHPGQVSFPGGQREDGEALSDTALREAKEEIGLDPQSVDVLGTLTPLYIPPSNFCVHPFLGAVSHAPALRPMDREVDEVLQVPVDHLLDPDSRIVETWTLHGAEVDVPYYEVEGYTVWGATAMMLAEVLELIRDVSLSE